MPIGGRLRRRRRLPDSSGNQQGLLLTESSGTWTATEAPLPTNANAHPWVFLYSDSVSCASAGNCVAVGDYTDSDGNRQGLLLTEASGTWTGTEAPLPADASTPPDVSLSSVSCPSASDCTAVGNYGSTVSLGLIETEVAPAATSLSTSLSGGGQSGAAISVLPDTAVTDSATLGGTSASTATGTVTYDVYSDSACTTAVSTGTPETITTPGTLPASTAVTLTTAGTYYWQASYSGDASNAASQSACGPTGEVETAAAATTSSWAPTEAPLPTGAGPDPSLEIDSVSCASAGNCAAVGDYRDSSGYHQGLLLTESSGTWTGTEAPLPAGAGTNPNVVLNSVSCPSAGDCAAVGDYRDSSGNQQGLLLTESSGTWTGAEAPLPAGAGTDPYVSLSSVSCPSAGDCAAVGSYSDSDDSFQGLLLTEASGTWTATKAPLPAGASGYGASLSSVSCASAGNCVAVGYYSDSSYNQQGLLLTEALGTWTATEAPLPAGAGGNVASLSSVSCPSAGNCAAVGYYYDSSHNQQGLLLTEASGTWTATEAPLPAGAGTDPYVSLSSVSCASAGNCAAVGYYTDSSGNGQGLLLTESSGTWTDPEAPLPAGAGTDPDVVPNSVSCPSAGDCAAVGYYTDSSGYHQGLLLTESSGTWTATEAPLPAGAGTPPDVSLSSVSCASAGNCAAVGWYADSSSYQQGLLVTEAEAGTLTQGSPTSATVANGAGYTGQLSVTNAVGTVSYTEDTSTYSTDVLVSSTGAITYTASALGAGTYTVTGEDSDTNTPADTGTWSFALTVSPAIVTLTQGSPTSATVADGAGYTGQLSVTNAVGTVSYTEDTSTYSTDVVVSSTGAITYTASALGAGTYTVTGEDSDTNTPADTGTWAFALTVSPPIVTLTQGSPTSATVADGTGYSGQLSVTNNTGAVSYSETTSADSTDVVVSSSGAISAPTTLVPGTYTVGGSDSDTNGDTGTWAFALTVSKAPQTISFGALANKTLAQSPVTVKATATSGLAVSFTTATSSVCTSGGTHGATITLVRTGTCTVKANQAGNATYSAAPTVARSFTVSKAPQTISFGTLANKTLAQSPVTVKATATSGLAVSFTTATSSVCTSGGTHGATITLVRTGTCTVKANQAGNATYSAAPTVARSFTVSKAPQTISFGALANKTLAQSPVTVKATATSGLAVSFTTATSSVCTSGGTHGATITLVRTGTCTVKANQAGNATYSAAPTVARSFTVSKAPQTISFGTLANKTLAQSPVTVKATATSGLAVSFTTATSSVCTSGGTHGATITLVRTGTCTVKANQAGNATYSAAPTVARSFTVSKAPQTISFGTLANKTLAQSPVTVKATATSGLAVSFTTATSSVCTSGGTHGATITLVRTGTCTVKANQAGNATYSAAPTVARSFTVRT